eukprot:7262310-Prymnesium_polylepis.1
MAAQAPWGGGFRRSSQSGSSRTEQPCCIRTISSSAARCEPPRARSRLRVQRTLYVSRTQPSRPPSVQCRVAFSS